MTETLKSVGSRERVEADSPVDWGDLGGTRMKYVVVQRTGFVPYFLSSWVDETEHWDCVRARAIVLDGPTARRIASQLNGRHSAAPVPISIEVLR